MTQRHCGWIANLSSSTASPIQSWTGRTCSTTGLAHTTTKTALAQWTRWAVPELAADGTGTGALPRSSRSSR